MKLKLIVIALGISIAGLIANREAQTIKNFLFHPGYSWCHKFRRTWDVVNGHSTAYADAHWVVTTPKGTNLFLQIHGVPNDGGTHEVTVTNGVSCFPLCEQCWKELKTPQARLPYYRQLVNERKRLDTETNKAEDSWPRMKASVMTGN
jgi:hypothetical protein